MSKEVKRKEYEMSVNQSRIALANIKYFAAGSEETSCFVATVMLDGKAFGEARNEGHGGATNIHVLYKNGVAVADGKAMMKAAEDFAMSLPTEVTDIKMGNGEFFTMKMDLEHLVDDLLVDYLVDMDLKKAFNRNIKKKVMFIKDGKVWLTTIKTAITPEVLKTVIPIIKLRNGDDIVILNTMDRDAAYAAYKAAA